MKTISNFRTEIKRAEYEPEEKEKLLHYMSRREFLFAASSAKITDFITGKRILDRPRLIYRDDSFEWESEEVYLLEKYDLALSKEFIQHVKQQS